MSQFTNQFAENKIRIPLSAYAAQIIESDCIFFSKKKTTLINAVILNSYHEANCSISLRLAEYIKEMSDGFSPNELKNGEPYIEKLREKRESKLVNEYVRSRPQADFHWQMTLNKKVMALLTLDTSSHEERYYKNRPGRYLQHLIEEYAKKPHHERESIIFRSVCNTFENAKSCHKAIRIETNRGKLITLKPYDLLTDPLSMYHYIVGYNIEYDPSDDNPESINHHKVLSLRLSRISDAIAHDYLNGKIELSEEREIQKALKKGVQFVSSDATRTTIWLSRTGIDKYNQQMHLRPLGIKDATNDHIYHFECTDTQIDYYFKAFGKEARILAPTHLVEKFRNDYRSALDRYTKETLAE